MRDIVDYDKLLPMLNIFIKISGLHQVLDLPHGSRQLRILQIYNNQRTLSAKALLQQFDATKHMLEIKCFPLQ